MINPFEDLEEELSGAVKTVIDNPLDKIQQGEEEVALPEELKLRLEHVREENNALKLKNDILKSKHEMRGKALLALFVFMSGWASLTFITYWSCEMSDALAITLFTTTLGQVLGLTTIALRWLFPNRDSV
jgi:hypothetical protein